MIWAMVMGNTLIEKIKKINWRKDTRLSIIYLALNASAFLGVGCQKMVGMNPEVAAFRDYVSYGREGYPLDLIYGIGLKVGHKVFYNQDDFREVAQEVMDKK